MPNEDTRHLAHLCGLADNPNLPVHLLDKLVVMTSGELDAGGDLFGFGGPGTQIPEAADIPAMESTGEVMARRTDLPVETYHQMATDRRLWVRLYLARNPALPESLLWTLADDRAVRPELAWNPNVPLSLLAEIAVTVNLPHILLPRVASATPPELRWLATAKDWQVRALAAMHKKLPQDLVDKLINDPETRVIQALVAAKNPNCPPELLHKLAHRSEPTCPHIAQHPNANAETLVACLRVLPARRHAAKHPNLPAETITELLDDPDLLVAEAAAANPALPRKVMERVLMQSC
ncbi:hypothetical protein [Kibdelosporangium phytohabitans]|uniref:Leucine rich repeat variant n=1 Tax=Kibdelosporangium phytohabitans TaxID=860235 RepID=A0A0N9I5A9_9PSEU|nr:hypothetical protein [Kibdelosporangium phytohabitans]ALG10834.1 hypothetical protein AOZ06_31640 [Kibdelosporangium phytohabitans]MBE1462009.1 hypothetical protein [Kibdelosporangium phytohabitans]